MIVGIPQARVCSALQTLVTDTDQPLTALTGRRAYAAAVGDRYGDTPVVQSYNDHRRPLSVYAAIEQYSRRSVGTTYSSP
jgi:hypothetical protein